MQSKYMMDAREVMKELNVSRAKAYQLLRTLNDELKEEGFITLPGKVPRAFWKKKFYGFSEVE